jgi:predicted PurR-regulated permease PerM
MNASLRLYSSTRIRFEERDRLQNIVKVLFSIMVTVSVISGSYTTIVFSLLGLYTKRALGRGLDKQVVEFFHETTSVREISYDILF